jgi:hypothetical protein
LDETARQPCFVKGRFKGMSNNCSRSAECIRTDAEDNRVAGPHHTTGVSEHVGTALKHETNNTERRTACFD